MGQIGGLDESKRDVKQKQRRRGLYIPQHSHTQIKVPRQDDLSQL